MTKTVTDIYTDIIDATADFAEMNGRYAVQAEAEAKIYLDVIKKLDLKKTDNLLEIGCGVGSLLVPLSNHVKSITGIDNARALDVISDRSQSDNITLIPGIFPNVALVEKYEKILIYGVILYMKTKEDLWKFLNAAIALLKPDGCLLIGDITTAERKKRFNQSERGIEFAKEWAEIVARNPGTDIVRSTETYLTFEDALVAEIFLHFRKAGMNSFILPQPIDLPFGNTREDIVVFGSEYAPNC